MTLYDAQNREAVKRSWVPCVSFYAAVRLSVDVWLCNTAGSDLV